MRGQADAEASRCGRAMRGQADVGAQCAPSGAGSLAKKKDEGRAGYSSTR